ncbi:chemotaxis protein CheA [Jonesiaceae bacterium BS-20]|uniref:histidine kinase n=1 Tax=Jonesiaceae bacterium BS-20 TaxID=3120821 RepID=A0AAU7DY02_9MICO
MDEIVREFLIESYENLDQLDQDLVALESNPGSRDLISSIFRTIHTIKGTSGFLALSGLEKVAHIGENLLVDLRDGKRVMDQPTTNVLLMMVDTIRDLLGRLDEVGSEEGVDTAHTLAALQAVFDNEGAPTPVAASPDAPFHAASEVTELPTAMPTPAVSAPAPVAPVEPVVAARQVAEGQVATSGDTGRHTSETSIRVDVDLLDELMRQVGELVLVRNQIAQLAGFDSGDLLRSSQRLSLIASELQDGVMKTRMQPIEHIWSKMPRVVRDLAAACNREVRLDLVGGDTELDRSLLESVKDPLTHLVRNAVDHGIESPADRVAKGKPAAGTLRLRAYHAGGQVVVEITDDGGGIDPHKIGAKALERGLRTAEQLALMSSVEIQDLVFTAGFSTAAQVTNVSGRGVGMDVVRANIEDIGGTVEVESQVDVGTTWRLRIPLTLAIMPALTVQSGAEIYAIPQVNLQELVALDALKTQGAIELIGDSEVYRLRGVLLPLIRLSKVLQSQGEPAQTAVIAVLQADNQRFGLIVDRVLNNEEIVVKPLSSALKNIGIYAGATLMGDGQVALILDTQAIARRELRSEITEKMAGMTGQSDTAVRGSVTEHLVVGVGQSPRRRVAIALSDITRLEILDMDRIEVVGGREVVQYREAIVPIIRLGSVLGSFGTAELSEPGQKIQKPTVVFTRGAKSIAMVVDEILEILNDDGALRSELRDQGLLGSIVLSGAVTEILDVQQVLLAADPGFFDQALNDHDLVADNFDASLVGV